MRRNIPEFEWEFNEKTQKYKEESEYENFSINISSPYQWGSGWTAKDEEDFHSDLFYNLKKVGFKNIVEGGDNISPSIKGRKPFDLTDVYLHPMEFSGYAKSSDIEKILQALESCCRSNVHNYYVNYRKAVNAMSDVEYKQLLIENTANIAKWLEKMEARGYKSWEMGETFARYFRIARVGDHTGLSSMDVDWSFVQDLYKIKEKLEEMKEQSMENNDFERDDR